MPDALKQWTRSQLEVESRRAVEHFIESRLEEPRHRYREHLVKARDSVRHLFAATENLRGLRPDRLVADPALLETARFLAGPPISQDDLKTLTGVKPPKRSLTSEEAKLVVETLQRAMDPERFPWIATSRAPTRNEVETAVQWTAGVWAVELIRTWRRTQASHAQEAMVTALLKKAGFRHSTVGAANLRPGEIDRLPRRRFSDELKLDGRKCDVPVRLPDGRVLAIECKVSNSSVNSIKRLVREVGGKADAWRRSFGEGIVTVAVLSGVYGVTTLLEAQEKHGVFLIWEHDLEPLRQFLAGSA